MAHKNGQRKVSKKTIFFSMKMIVGSTLKLSAKVIYFRGQVPIKNYGLKTLLMLFNMQKK